MTLSVGPSAASIDVRPETSPKSLNENLVSFVMVSCGEDGRDVDELRKVAGHVESRFEFHELIYVLGGRRRGVIDNIRENLAGLRNLRIIVLHIQSDYDELLIHGMIAAIGDYVIAFYPGEATTEEVDRLLEVCVADRRDLVRASRRGERQTVFGRAWATLLRSALRALVGRKVEPLQCRVLCLSRAVLAKLMEHPWALRHFRLVDMSDLFNEGRIWLDGAAPRADPAEAWRRARLVAQLIALRMPQLLTALAVVMMACSMLSALFGVYALGVWLFRQNVVEGWTSISLVISFMATAIFGTLSAISLGVTQVLQSGRRRSDAAMSQEFSNADLFSEMQRLNVEIQQED